MSNANGLFTGEDDWDCPLCMEEMDLSDKNFRPCPCGYQVCRFCWHKIREDGNQRCPACRKVYNEDEVEFIPVPQEEINRMRQKKRAIKEKREAAAAAELDLSPAGVALTNEIVNSRRHLCEFRVIQRNLVYVIGISAKIAHEHILKEPEFFGQFGKIIKIVVNKKNFLASSSGSNPPSASAYITFVRKDDAARAIEFVDGSVYDDRVIRATYGTTKYCSYFLRGLGCQNPGCMYLHEPGEEVQSFTKEQLSGGNHNLQSFIVDKSESANLRQFGTVLYNPATATTATVHKAPSVMAPVPLSQPSAQSAFLAPQSTTPAPSRSLNDSPKPFAASSVPAAPPGLKAPVAESFTEERYPVPERVPLINELSTNSFFDRISKMVTSSELEEFASMAPRGMSFFAPKSPPPPPPALSSFFNFSPLDASSNKNFRQQAPSPVEPSDHLVSSNSSCPSRQSFSFANLPIRSPKLSASPAPLGIFDNSNGPLTPAAPAPIKALPVDSLFPSDYRPSVAALEQSTTSSTNFEANKKFFSTKQTVNSTASSVSASAAKSIPTGTSSSVASSASSSLSSSYSNVSNFQQQPPSPALKITIAGKPIDAVPVATSSGVSSVKKELANPAAFTNKNLFDLLQGGESEPVEMPSPSSSLKKTGAIGPIKTISSQSMQPQTLADLEKMARENKLENHIIGLEETMFRTRLEAESLESKLKMLFEASAQAKHPFANSRSPSASKK